VTGIYRNNFDLSLNARNGFPVFSTIIEANHIARKSDQFAVSQLNEDDIKRIRQLSKQPEIIDKAR
jgi:DNA replication licensing factor MCM2